MLKILVADDNPVSREFVREALEDEYAIAEAGDGVEALAKIRSELPDLILLDIQMPKMDGFGVLEELQKDPELRSICTVALTAFAMQGDRQKVLQAGFHGYIAKPVSLLELRTHVRRLLSCPQTSG